MSTQGIDLTNWKLEVPEALFATERVDSKETAVVEKEQEVPDEFEIRRKLFFAA